MYIQRRMLELKFHVYVYYPLQKLQKIINDFGSFKNILKTKYPQLNNFFPMCQLRTCRLNRWNRKKILKICPLVKLLSVMSSVRTCAGVLFLLEKNICFLRGKKG